MLTELIHGNLIFAAPHLEELSDFLAQERVLAAIEWEAGQETKPALAEDGVKRGHVYLLTLVLLGGKVAQFEEHEGEPTLVPGPTPGEFLARLAERFPVDAQMAGEWVDSLPDEVVLGNADDTEDPERVRSLVFVPTQGFTAPLVAQGEGIKLASRDCQAGTFLVFETPDWAGPDLTQWDGAVMVRRAVGALTAVADSQLVAVFGQDPTAWVIHDWSVERRVVAGGLATTAARGMAEDMLASPQGSFEALAASLPTVDAEALELATLTTGEDAVNAALAAIGAPADLAAYLSGEGTLELLDDVILHEPRGVANAIGRTIQFWEDSAAEDSSWWKRYVETVEKRPAVIAALVAAEVVAGGALLASATRKRHGAFRRIFSAVGGAALLIEAASEVALAGWLRSKRD